MDFREGKKKGKEKVQECRRKLNWSKERKKKGDLVRMRAEFELVDYAPEVRVGFALSLGEDI